MLELHAGLCKWTTIENCLDMSLQVVPGNDRLGPLVVLGLLNDVMQSGNRNVPTNLPFQVYYLYLYWSLFF